MHLDEENFVYCTCTHVRFCSEGCQQSNPHKDCPGPPKAKFDVEESVAQVRASGGGRSADTAARQNQENLETVQKPFMTYMLSKGVQNLNPNMTAWDYAKWADEGDGIGNQACAFMAGSRFRHRMLSAARITSRGGLGGMNRKEDDISVLESQELAFKYFEKAAKLGHGLSMQSLGTCFDDGVGCKANRRRCNHWLWRACLHHSQGAIELLDSRALLTIEINAHSQALDRALFQLVPGQSMQLGGPNLGTLLCSFLDIIQKEQYSLPPFAGALATATVNNRLTTMGGESRIPLVGLDAIKNLEKKIKFMETRGNAVQFSYGRRGAAKTATALTHGAASRDIDNQIFFPPPAAACDETIGVEQIPDWYRQIVEGGKKGRVINPFCVHSEKNGKAALPSLSCRECEIDAVERLGAVAKGSVVLSMDEELPQRGQAVIFRSSSNGSLKTETWKNYAGGEAECVLAIIAASGEAAYAAPLFIAQDPNFFWPLIADHGSIRAALEFVAPHIDWDEKLGVVKQNNFEQIPVIPSCRPGTVFRKCGSSFCNNLEDCKAKGFLYCTGCNRRQYCCVECQLADWTVHKQECKLGLSSKESSARREDRRDDDTNKLQKKYEFNIQKGDDVVLHSLQSKPQYNGMVGIVGEAASNGRLALALRDKEEHVLSIKPDNLYCMGVFCRSRRKKSRVFECIHGLEVCDNCYFDFTPVNRLAKLKYSGQDFSTSHAIDQVNETYFSSFDRKVEEQITCDKDLPLQCYGMENHPKQRFILKALLETESQMSLYAEVARTAFITYGARKQLLLGSDTQLAKVAAML